VSSLRHKGFCQINPRLEEADLRGAVSEIEDLEALGHLKRPPALLVDGLLGNEGSSKIMKVGWPDKCPKCVEDSQNLLGCNAFLTEMFDSVAFMLDELGLSCTSRSEGILHETGVPDEEEAVPDMKENDALPWLALLQRHRIMLILNLSAIAGTLELHPFDADAEAHELATPPGSLTFVRVDAMTHKHFSHSKTYLLSCYLLEEPRTQSRTQTFVRQMNAIPCAKALEDWIDKRMQDLKEEEADTGILHKKLSLEWIHAMNKTYHVTQRIAVRGLDTRFASTWDPVAYYRMMHPGPDLCTEIPLMRWNNDEWYDPDPESWKRNKTFTKHMSYVEGTQLFDCRFFSLSPAEAGGMDPHQRFVLESGYCALAKAGYKKGKMMNANGGVYIGTTQSSWGAVASAVSATGAATSITSNRFSFCLGLKGPSLSIDTEGSSGLSAVHAGSDGCHNVGRGVPNPFSLSGGLYIDLSPMWRPQYHAAGLLSMQGRCFSFDQSAEGYVIGEGCGMVCLKRAEEIIDDQRIFIDNEPLYGMIAGSKGNVNGRTSGFNAPSGVAQQELYGHCLEAAALRGCDIEVVEANGEGWGMADVVELASLSRSFRSEASFAPLAITASKTTLGHPQYAGGMAAFIKLLFGNSFGTVAPCVHLQQLNPLAEPDSEMTIMSECYENDGNDSIFSGVGARGFGGSNVFVITYGAVDEERNPDLQAEVLEWYKQKDQPVYWPGGGGELDSSMTPMRNYFVTGTFSKWKPQLLEDEGDGSYGLTIVLGENLWEDFHILLDGDRTKRLHPYEMRGVKGSSVDGPDDVSGMYWRIDGEAEGSEMGQKYRIHFTTKGKYRGVTWERLDEEALYPAGVQKGSYSIVGDWSCWTKETMTEEGGKWIYEVKLLQKGGQFQILRDGDWHQVICPAEPKAEASVPGSRPEVATETRGYNWSFPGKPGETWRIEFKRDGQESTVTWQLSKTEKLTDDEAKLGRRAQFTVLGSWTDFLDHNLMTWEGQPVAKPATYSAFVKLGANGRESFNICEEGDWERMLSPEAEAGVWIIGEEEGSASPGDIYKISVNVVKGIVMKVDFGRAGGADLELAVKEGRILKAAA